MANHKSAIKRHRQNTQRGVRNHAVKARVRTLIKKVRGAIEGKNVEEADQRVREAVRALDKAASKGVLHRNSAARRISRLTAQVGRLRATPE